MIESLLSGISQVMQFDTLIIMAIGTIAGIISGAIPGFTITMAVILTLPLTFSMEPMQGAATILSVYVGGLTGGLISAALLGIPGTPSSVATTFDAFPMARNGRPGQALSLGIWGSFFGTIISVIVLMLAAPPLALIAVNLGPWEYFSLIIFALTIVASLVGESMSRGLIAGLIGLFLSTVGPDPMMGRPRFNFGIDALDSGLPFLVVLIGVFAISQLMSEVEDANSVKSGKKLISGNFDFEIFKTFKLIITHPVNLIRSSLLGVFIGTVPGAGSSISNLVAYDQAKRFSKNPENFGKGEPQGVIASESGNSSTAGGGLIPLLALGIPGSAVDAILMGALMIHGVTIGPTLIIESADLVYGMFTAMIIAAILMLVLSFVLMKHFIRITETPKYIVVPIVLTCCSIGAYTLANRATDLYILAGVGLVGYLLKRLDYPLAPLVLGVILGPIAETNLRRALMSDENWHLFLTRPISAFFLILAAVSLIVSIRRHLKSSSEKKNA